MQVEWSVPAIQDLNNIYDFIWQQSPAAAERIFANIEAQCLQLGNFPELGRIIAKPHFDATIRRIVIGNYLVFYRVRNENILIQRIFDSRQDPEKLSGLNSI